MNSNDTYLKMTKAAADFARLDAANAIAGEIISIARKHK